MSATNHALSQIFTRMADVYRYLGAGERFRALAYSKAAQVIDGLREDISVYLRKGTVEDIPGVGESIHEKIEEFVHTGKIRKYEELKKQVPVELLELMQVSGFGPQTIKQIHDELNISDRDALVRAIEDGRISQLKGFGPRKVENMMRGLKLHKVAEERIVLWKALSISESIKAKLQSLKEVDKIEIAGSIRRGKDTIGDIDILVACAPIKRKKIIDFFTSLPEVNLLLAKGETKASMLVHEFNRQVDLRVINEHEWGAALLYFTGSKEHNIHLRTLAKERDMKINEYGVFSNNGEKRLAGKTEAEIYSLMKLEYIPPELREMRGEFEVAARKKLPKLIEWKDIRGDMQMHSNWSDGALSIETLARYVMNHYDYDYIVLTDHSKSSRIAGGKDEKEMAKQLKEIDRVNKKLGRDFIKKGIEVDILPDGTLDFSDRFLSQLDWVCASIHSGFTKDNTDRLIKACQHPYVHGIGHPSGRLIGKREAYRADWPKVFRAAAKTGTSMEINAQPDRMDLNDVLARQAVEAGVNLTISTDSHQADHFEYMKLGVITARRAWCEAKQVLNTRPWKEVEAFTAKKRKRTSSSLVFTRK